MIYRKDCLTGLRSLESDSVDCIITSPPYNKRGLQGRRNGNQIWQGFQIDYDDYEDNLPEYQYQAWMIEILQECFRVIKPTGSIFFNHKPRRHRNRVHLPTEFISQSQVPVYQLIIWDRRASPNIRNDILIPATEHIYWLCKDKPRSFRSSLEQDYRGEVWRIPADKSTLHPAPFPEQLVENCMLLATQIGDLVVDPFMGSGTTAVVAERLHRRWIGYETSSEYCKLAEQRLNSARTCERRQGNFPLQ